MFFFFKWALFVLIYPSTETHQVAGSLISPISLNDIPPRITQAMENEEHWDFDIFELEAATHKRSVNYGLVNTSCWELTEKSACSQLLNFSTCAFHTEFLLFSKSNVRNFLTTCELIKHLLFHHTLFLADSQWVFINWRWYIFDMV